MARQNYSRLAKTENKKAVKSTMFYVVLIMGLIVFLFVLGIPALGQLTNILSQFTSSDQTISNADGPPPSSPNINSLPDFTNERKLVVSGSTRAGYTVVLHLNDELKEVISDADGNFSSSFGLKDGSNSFYATVIDKSGRESVQTKASSIVFDNKPPKLEIISPQNDKVFFGSQNQKKKIQDGIEGSASVSINEHVVVLAGDGKNDYKIKVRDEAGNEIETLLTLNFTR